VGLAGGSGSGKSMTTLAILGLADGVGEAEYRQRGHGVARAAAAGEPDDLSVGEREPGDVDDAPLPEADLEVGDRQSRAAGSIKRHENASYLGIGIRIGCRISPRWRRVTSKFPDGSQHRGTRTAHRLPAGLSPRDPPLGAPQ